MSFPFRHPSFQTQATLKDADVVLALEAVVPWVPGRNAPGPEAFVVSVGRDPIEVRIPTFEFTADLRLATDSLTTILAITEAARDRLSDGDRERIAARKERLAASSGPGSPRRKMPRRPGEDRSDRPVLGELSDRAAARRQLHRARRDASAQPDAGLFRPQRAGLLFRQSGVERRLGDRCGAGRQARRARARRHRRQRRWLLHVRDAGPGVVGGRPSRCAIPADRLHQPRYTTGTERIAASYGADGYAAQAGFEGGWFDPPIDFAKEAEAAGAHGETVPRSRRPGRRARPRPATNPQRQAGPGVDLAQAPAGRGLTGAGPEAAAPRPADLCRRAQPVPAPSQSRLWRRSASSSGL